MVDFIRNLIKFGRKDSRTIPSYVLVERQISETEWVTGIKITDGKYSGMVFTTSPTVSFVPGTNGEMKLKYEYLIQIPPKEELVADDIGQTIGDILLDIIIKNHVEEGIDANRESDTQCPGEGS